MTWFVILWLSMRPTPAQAQALATWDGALKVDQASEQITAAQLAGVIYRIDPALLLGIAHHESRFHESTVTREPGRRVSCGVMTPTPQRRCSSGELTVEGGYLAGAAHYRMWLDHCRGSEWCALVAYAGGMGLVRVCRVGRWLVHGRDICDVAYAFRSRARAIRRAVYSSVSVSSVVSVSSP